MQVAPAPTGTTQTLTPVDIASPPSFSSTSFTVAPVNARSDGGVRIAIPAVVLSEAEELAFVHRVRNLAGYQWNTLRLLQVVLVIGGLSVFCFGMYLLSQKEAALAAMGAGFGVTAVGAIVYYWRTRVENREDKSLLEWAMTNRNRSENARLYIGNVISPVSSARSR